MYWRPHVFRSSDESTSDLDGSFKNKGQIDSVWVTFDKYLQEWHLQTVIRLCVHPNTLSNIIFFGSIIFLAN